MAMVIFYSEKQARLIETLLINSTNTNLGLVIGVFVRLLFAMIFVGISSKAEAGSPFDEIRYMNYSLASNVASELHLSEVTHITREKRQTCNGLDNCTALIIRAPLSKSSVLEKIIVAMANPCGYAKSHTVAIKNSDLRKSRENPYINGKEFFCSSGYAKGVVMLTLIDVDKELTDEAIRLLVLQK